MLSNRALSNAPSRAAPSNAKSSENVAACAMQRGPLTRRQHLLARNRSENERASRLLSLSDDVLGHVCSFLDGRDLARLETVCTHFKHRSWVAVNEASLPEQSAKRKLDAMTLGEMPPGFRKMKYTRKLSVVEQRGIPLTHENVTTGMWVRVKKDVESVKKMCRGEGDAQDYAVGWEQGMDDTVGKPFPVGVVSKAYRQSPVVGLSVPNGLVAIAGGRYPTYGWYYPLEALEHV